MTTTITYLIPETNTKAFERRLKSIKRKADKIGNGLLELTKHDREVMIQRSKINPTTGNRDKYLAIVKPYTLSFEAPMIAGWSFVGTVDHTQGFDDTLDFVLVYVHLVPLCSKVF